MGNIKQINIKNRRYYFFNHMINTKNFDLKILIFITLHILQSKLSVIIKIFKV